eukprot:TRINITY_DN15931_c0_g1_i7.p1 TRINITY_DN15931_c0_g1~~TRINITY_DN15931_c0_g1_i7.p1  ORF type:complete len:447 (+),score=80.14 TRINITY_DN15931_c0_g1_i7:237-1577(+)
MHASLPARRIHASAVLCRSAGCNPNDSDGPQPMSRSGFERTSLAKMLAMVMDAMPRRPRYFLDSGTLLGLWRDGDLIEKDDDFDFGLLVEKGDFSSDWVAAFQQDLQSRLEQHLRDTGSEKEYLSRVVDTYADKIEFYDPSAGSFPLEGARYEGARYHHVSVDLQLHVMDQMNDHPLPPPEVPPGSAMLINEGEVLAGRGVTIRHTDFATRGQAPGNAYEPFGSVPFAGRDWPVPAKPKKFLGYLYGYVGHSAELDQHSKLYRKPLVAASGDRSAPVRLYTDMCADLFHVGHTNYLRQCRDVAENVHLIVGIHSDATIESYKRAPVCTMEERVGVVSACEFVDTVLSDAPLRVTEVFMDRHGIDFVIHGTETPELERQAMYDIPIGRGMYTEVPRTVGISTTKLIDRIASRLAVDYEHHALPSDRKAVGKVVRELTMNPPTKIDNK